MDINLFHWVNALPHPGLVDQVALVFEFFGRSSVFLVFGGSLLIVGHFANKPVLKEKALFFTLTTLSVGVTTAILKHLVNRPRPYEMIHDVYLIGQASGASFPSGHAAFFALLSLFIFLYFKKPLRMVLPIVLFGGIFRIYQGMHYPSDVCAGWALGGSITWGLWLFYQHVQASDKGLFSFLKTRIKPQEKR